MSDGVLLELLFFPVCIRAFWSNSFLFFISPSIPLCLLINRHLSLLAQKFPETKFLKAIAKSCIEDYHDSFLPTLFVYENGEIKGKFIGIADCGGTKLTVEGNIQNILRNGLKLRLWPLYSNQDENCSVPFVCRSWPCVNYALPSILYPSFPSWTHLSILVQFLPSPFCFHWPVILSAPWLLLS